MHTEAERDAERAKYEEIYAGGFIPDYGASEHFRDQEQYIAQRLAGARSVLDVGCGNNGFGRWCCIDQSIPYAVGVDFVGEEWKTDKRSFRLERRVAEATALPFSRGSFEWACSFDTLEHLLPGDVDRAIEELARVARVGLIIAVASCSAEREFPDGRKVQLHPTQRPGLWWGNKFDQLGKIVYRPGSVRWRHFFFIELQHGSGGPPIVG